MVTSLTSTASFEVVVWVLAVLPHIRYQVRLSSGGKSYPLGRIRYSPTIYIVQHAPDGSPMGRVLRVLLLKEEGRDAERDSLLAIRLGRGRVGDGWY